MTRQEATFERDGWELGCSLVPDILSDTLDHGPADGVLS